LHTVQLEPELLPGLVRMAEELRAVVPRLVVDGWPAVSAVDQPGARATPR
jgi:hypothetical protein